MHIVDFMTELGAKFAPITAHSLQTMKVQLTDSFEKQLEKFKQKQLKNQKIMEDLKKKEIELENAIEQNDMQKHSDIAYRMAEQKKSLDQPTLIEKACAFFDKPVTKFVLMLIFGLVASLIARRLLRKDKEVEEPEDESFNYQQQPYYPPYPQYPPYGYPPNSRYGHNGNQR